MSTSPQSGVREFERLTWLKYYFVLKGQNTFNLGFNTAKVHIKSKKYKLFRMKFHTRKSMGAHVYHLQEWSQGPPRWIRIKYSIVLKWESKCTLGLNAAEITNNYIKKLFKQRWLRMKFHTRKSVSMHIYLPQQCI